MTLPPTSPAPAEAGRTGDEDNDDVRDPAYFQYYGKMQHQQNMLQDTVRTATYQSAILQNGPAVFKDKLVLDVGAGSGILSYFAVQAGAAKVYAVEASEMAHNIQALLWAADPRRAVPHNMWLHNKIEVINAKMESPKVQIPQVDVIISEPIGVLLVHERMLESFIYARDKFLKPGGAILPSMGTIHLAPFTDPLLYNETMAKVRFWEQTSFYGVDVTPLYAAALDEYFRMPVVGYFDPRSLVAAPDAAGYPVDFATVTMEALQEFSVPFNWTCRYTGLVHGVAGWFDLDFQPPAALARSAPVTMSTGPQAARTHWQQVRLLLQEPLAVNARQIIQGTLHCKVNDKRSYDLTAELHLLPMGTSKIAAATDRLPAGTITRQATWLLHEQTYNHSTYPNLVDDQGFFPELSNLYAPDMTQVGNAASLLPLPPVYSTNDYAEATGDAAAIEVSLQTPVITSPDHSQDSQAMAEDTSFSAV